MRKLLDWLLPCLTGLCAAGACTVLGLIVLAISVRGFSALNLRFITEQIRLVGAEGGIFYNLVGTGILVLTALLVSCPIATALALVQAVYRKHDGNGRRALTLLLYTLNGIPSILFGIFGLIVFVLLFHWGKSWLSGGILLGFMIVPTITIALIESIEALPSRYLDAAASLGLTESQVIWSVILPQTRAGLFTGSLLGLARAAGETAPIMFTATIFAGATYPTGIRQSPVLSLPYHIFTLAQDSFDPAVGAKLWGAALVLLLFVLSLSLIALPLRLRIHAEANS